MATTRKYTVIGTVDMDSRFADHVTARSPKDAEAQVQMDRADQGDVAVAGVFEGWQQAVDDGEVATTHTPGPWEVSKHATPEAFPQFGVYAGESHRDLATVKGSNAEADAALIAAAPELLWAVRRAKVIQSKPKGWSANEISVSWKVWHSDVEVILAKAEGRQ